MKKRYLRFGLLYQKKPGSTLLSMSVEGESFQTRGQCIALADFVKYTAINSGLLFSAAAIAAPYTSFV